MLRNFAGDAFAAYLSAFGFTCTAIQRAFIH